MLGSGLTSFAKRHPTANVSIFRAEEVYATLIGHMSILNGGEV